MGAVNIHFNLQTNKAIIGKGKSVMQKFFYAFIIISILLAGCNPAPAQLSEQDMAAIYQAVIRQIYLVDNTFGGEVDTPMLYIIRATDDMSGDPNADEANSILLSEKTQQDISNALADLNAKIVWVDNFEQVSIDDTGIVSDGGAIVTLGNIKMENENKVLVPVSLYFANLGAGGRTYIVEKKYGVWTVTGDTGVRWVS